MFFLTFQKQNMERVCMGSVVTQRCEPLTAQNRWQGNPGSLYSGLHMTVNICIKITGSVHVHLVHNNQMTWRKIAGNINLFLKC